MGLMSEDRVMNESGDPNPFRRDPKSEESFDRSLRSSPANCSRKVRSEIGFDNRWCPWRSELIAAAVLDRFVVRPGPRSVFTTT